jgi:hypothetical protein
VSEWSAQIVYLAMFSLGLGAITYDAAAIERGWPSGRIYQNDASALKLVAFCSVLAAIVLSFWQLPWRHSAITIIGGYALMAVLLGSLKKYFQRLPLVLFPLTPYAIGIRRVQ